MISFKGKVALVTGGGAGIGRGIAETFAELGAHVVVIEIDPARADNARKALDAAGAEATVIVGDATKAADVTSFMAQVEKKFGRLDILVNNVGDFLRITKPFEETTEADWEALYGVNLRHIFLVTKAGIPLLRRAGPGSTIISVSTIEAFRGIPMGSVYSAFKTAITGFTRSLALELGGDGIRVNAIAPETTESEQIKVSTWLAPENKDRIKGWIPLGRFGEAKDIAGCAVFLASDLSAWVTGTTINVDGGALAAAGFVRMADGRWTHRPLIAGFGYDQRKGRSKTS